ncbi:MAG: hypothetical protein NXH78_02000 [Hyphomonadaceae bacterium]|nr:hypothetical protein [Hyphomonadaceae bacterium]
MNWFDFGLAFSFTEEAETSVGRTFDVIGSSRIYYYKQLLGVQWGEKISTLSEKIYSNLPCVVWMNESWTVSAATRFERDQIMKSQEPVLVLKSWNGNHALENRRGTVTVNRRQFEPAKDAQIILDWMMDKKIILGRLSAGPQQ